MLEEDVAHDGDERGVSAVQLLADAEKYQAQIVMPDGCRNHFPAAMHLLQQLALGEFQAVGEIVKLLLALVDQFHHASEGTVLREFSQSLAAHQQLVTHSPAKALMQGRGVILD